MQQLIFIANTVFPVFIIIGLGYVLQRLNIINQQFNSVSSKIVFNIALPALVFNEVVKVDISNIMDFKLIEYIYVGTFVTFLLAWVVAVFFKTDPESKGAFIQASFRGNSAIIGVALIGNASRAMLGKTSFMLAFVIPLYNVLAVIALAFPLKGKRKLSKIQVLNEILTNPLIICMILAMILSAFHFKLPEVLERSVSYLAALTLPLALIGIGATLSNGSWKESPKLSITASIMKIVVCPLLLTTGAIWFGFRGGDLLILFILFSSPTAIVSYVMADAMGSNSRLSSSIVLISTILSIFTISAGLIMLRSWGYI